MTMVTKCSRELWRRQANPPEAVQQSRVARQRLTAVLPLHAALPLRQAARLLQRLLPPHQAQAPPEPQLPCRRRRCRAGATPGAADSAPMCAAACTPPAVRPRWLRLAAAGAAVTTANTKNSESGDSQTRRKDTTAALRRSEASPQRSSFAEPAARYTLPALATTTKCARCPRVRNVYLQEVRFQGFDHDPLAVAPDCPDKLLC